MVEVLVSILVLSAGVLGAAGGQLAAIRTTQQASYQTTAIQLAADIADAVHAHAMGGTHAESLGRMLDLDYTSIPDMEPEPGGICYFNECDPGQFTESEVNEWKMRLATSFPSARLRICRDANPWNEAGQAYKWDCSGTVESGAPLVIKLGWLTKNPDGTLVKDGQGRFPPAVVLPVVASMQEDFRDEE